MFEKKQKETDQEQPTNMLHGKKRQIPTIYYTVALIVAVGLLFSLGNSNFISVYNLNTIASFGAILLMVALGQMCAILIGGIDLSVGGVMSFVSVVFVKVVPATGYWAYPLCILLGVFIGYINGNILTRIKIPSFIATLGTGGILMSLAMIVAPVPVNVPSGSWGILDVFNQSFLTINNALYISVLIFLLYAIVLRLTIIGRNIFHVGSNIKMSWMSGINVVKTRNVAFMLSAFGAATAGIMVSATSLGSNPYVGSPYILNSIASVVVGGTALTGGIGGAINTLCGALLLSVLQNGMTVVGVDQYFQQSILGLMIIISVVLTFDRSKTPVIK